MKRLLPLLLALLLLSGCAGISAGQEPEDLPTPAAETASLPPLTPLAELSAPAVVTEGRAAAIAYDLPQDLRVDPIGDDAFPVLLAELPGAAFYGIRWDTALIRWGGCLAEFDWYYLTPRQIFPRLFCLDIDDDREDELIAVCYSGSGTGVSYEELHILKKGPEGTLTDYALPRELFTEELTAAMSVETVNGRTYSILGTQLADITGLLPEDEDPAAIEGLSAGDIVYFEATPDAPFGERLRFHGAAWLMGEPFPPTACYAADLEAAVSFKDGVFTLSNFQLS